MRFLALPLLSAVALIGLGVGVVVGMGTSARADVVPSDFTFAGYMRSGIGDNSKGGKQVCFTNPGTVANEFRLGNECGTYGEASFRVLMLKPQNADDTYFRSQLTFAYFPPNDTQYEDSTVVGGHDINVIEAFVEGGNFGDFKGSLWAGKRFYRTVDAHMNDFYYFENMNGTGGGIEKWKLPYGLISVALLRESTFAQPGLPASGFFEPSSAHVDSESAGILGKTAADVRYDLPISDRTDISFWGVAAYSPPGSGTVISPAPSGGAQPSNATATYEAGQGYVAGVYTRHRLDVGGFNDVSVAYGTGIMQSLEMGAGYGASGPAGVIAGSGGNNASRLRVMESMTRSFGPKWATHAVITYEDRNSGASTDAHATWWDIGFRPYYALSEHFSLVAEVGHSEVHDEADHDKAGNHIASRQLTRVTFAPQLAVKSDIFARPVIRAFITHSIWNDANQTFTHLGASESISPTSAYVTEVAGTSFGVQAEVWF